VQAVAQYTTHIHIKTLAPHASTTPQMLAPHASTTPQRQRRMYDAVTIMQMPTAGDM